MLLYEGKAKQVYSTESENEFIVYLLQKVVLVVITTFLQ